MNDDLDTETIGTLLIDLTADPDVRSIPDFEEWCAAKDVIVDATEAALPAEVAR